MDANYTICLAEDPDIKDLQHINGDKSQGYFNKCFQKQAGKELDIFVVKGNKKIIAYALLNYYPKYKLFSKLGIPEIQDLKVLREFRRKGVGTHLVRHCIEYAKNKGNNLIGISVGLHSAFGPAQRLYCKLGFVPDGHGISYDRVNVSAGDIRPIDDELCLMMIKEIERT
jgi:ribosomal protein S18 acetylase RimI-like enzyme